MSAALHPLHHTAARCALPHAVLCCTVCCAAQHAAESVALCDTQDVALHSDLRRAGLCWQGAQYIPLLCTCLLPSSVRMEAVRPHHRTARCQAAGDDHRKGRPHLLHLRERAQPTRRRWCALPSQVSQESLDDGVSTASICALLLSSGLLRAAMWLSVPTLKHDPSSRSTLRIAASTLPLSVCIIYQPLKSSLLRNARTAMSRYRVWMWTPRVY